MIEAKVQMVKEKKMPNDQRKSTKTANSTKTSKKLAKKFKFIKNHDFS
jgi:hypothetical protein